MDSEAVKANERRLFEALNKRKRDAVEKWIDAFIAEDFVNHSPSHNKTPDRDGLKEMMWEWLDSSPDLKINIHDLVFENDILCFRAEIEGIANDETFTGLAMVKFKNGKMVERWACDNVPPVRDAD